MRGQGCQHVPAGHGFGITPADAGTRPFFASSIMRKKDHPRGCGDKSFQPIPDGIYEGSPPRMRGQGLAPHDAQRVGGITPADAGTSECCQHVPAGHRDHPRGCGDKPARRHSRAGFLGSPPRMRGQAASRMASSVRKWITPADAGTSFIIASVGWNPADHPRGCGDKLAAASVRSRCLGSPPRMRGQV